MYVQYVHLYEHVHQSSAKHLVYQLIYHKEFETRYKILLSSVGTVTRNCKRERNALEHDISVLDIRKKVSVAHY